jgi:hypothetical protein
VQGFFGGFGVYAGYKKAVPHTELRPINLITDCLDLHLVAEHQVQDRRLKLC